MGGSTRFVSSNQLLESRIYLFMAVGVIGWMTCGSHRAVCFGKGFWGSLVSDGPRVCLMGF